MKRSYGREHRQRRGYCRKPRARAERRESRHRRRARFAKRSADHEHMSVATFVAFARSGREQRSEVVGSAEMKSELGDDGFGRRADGRNQSGPGGELCENVGWTRSGKGHDGIGAGLVAHAAVRVTRAWPHGVGIGAGGNVDGDDWSGG